MRTTTILSIVTVLLFLSACRGKEDAPSPNRDLTAAQDNYRAELYFADALKQSDIAHKDGAAGCIQNVLVDLTVMPRTMLVDFGNTNCTGADGLQRRGRLLVTFTGPYSEAGTVITITPQDYHVNDHLLQGVKTVTNAGPDDQGNTHFIVTVAGTVTAPDGSWTSTHNYQRTRTWIAGEGTAALLDDVYLITGGGSGVNRHGTAFTVQITTPLRVEVGCPWIVSGVQEIVPQGQPARVIDFGQGGCDAQVTITVGNFSFVVGG
jgi:hypothetical protein